MNDELKAQIVKGYEYFKTNDDISELVCNTVIPNFDIIACNIDEIINEIESKNNDNQVLDYIEMIFNSSLYESIITEVKSFNIEPCYNYFHYLMILIEVSKINKYNEINSRLNQILNNTKTDKEETPFGVSVLIQATEEKINNCKNRIKYIHNNLVTDFPELINCKIACNELLNSSNIII